MASGEKAMLHLVLFADDDCGTLTSLEASLQKPVLLSHQMSHLSLSLSLSLSVCGFEVTM